MRHTRGTKKPLPRGLRERLRFLASILPAFLLVVAGISACSEDRDASPGPVRLAFISTLSGEYQDIGRITLDAARLAVDQANAEGGVMTPAGRRPVELVVLDPGSTVEGGLDALRAAVQREHALAVVGGFLSRDAIPMAKVAEELHVPFITPGSTNPETTRGLHYTWRMPFTDSFQGAVLGQFALNELGAARAAVLYDSAGDYNRGLAESFREAFSAKGGHIAAFAPYLTGTTDWSEHLRRILAERPDLLLLPNYHDEVLPQARQARQAGFTGVILGGDGWEMLSQGPDLAALNGSFFTTTWDPGMDTGRSREFRQAFEKAYNQTPNGTACLTYDAFGLIFTALGRVRALTPTDLRDALAQVETLEGAGGLYRYRGGGDPEKSAVILRIENGRFQLHRELPPVP
ncbi:ABC transporter substrate-binding protein [Desulfovibrio aminophilus]|uniref:ABC transporter substrate-binding protein n=1 Tax=Desulfovibrio aminophilus TaxID=81425 RepID=UPI003396D5EA